jgi:hypothetical protein
MGHHNTVNQPPPGLYHHPHNHSLNFAPYNNLLNISPLNIIPPMFGPVPPQVPVPPYMPLPYQQAMQVPHPYVNQASMMIPPQAPIMHSQPLKKVTSQQVQHDAHHITNSLLQKQPRRVFGEPLISTEDSVHMLTSRTLDNKRSVNVVCDAKMAETETPVAENVDIVWPEKRTETKQMQEVMVVEEVMKKTVLETSENTENRSPVTDTSAEVLPQSFLGGSSLIVPLR